MSCSKIAVATPTGAPVEPTPLHIALVNPEIPGNTGNIGRLCVGIGATLHLVHPLGFDIDAKAVRRAGLDYWKDVDLMEHASADAFYAWAEGRPVVAFTAHGSEPYSALSYPPGVVLVFGRETKGLPDEAHARFQRAFIPAPGPVRSLNLSNAAAVAAYHALSEIRPEWFAPRTV